MDNLLNQAKTGLSTIWNAVQNTASQVKPIAQSIASTVPPSMPAQPQVSTPGVLSSAKQWLEQVWNAIWQATKSIIPGAQPISPTPTDTQAWQIKQNADQWIWALPIKKPVATTTTQTGQPQTPAQIENLSKPLAPTQQPSVPPVQVPPTTPSIAPPTTQKGQATSTQPLAGAQPQQPAPTPLYTWATAEKKQEADKLITAVDPAGVMSPALQSEIKEAYLSGDQSKMQSIFNANNIDLANTQNYMGALRMTRDLNLQQTHAQSQQDRATQRIMMEYDTAIVKQQQNIRATANNMSVQLDGAGRLQSQNTMDAIVQEMGNQQRILQNLQTSKALALWEIVEGAHYNNQVMANQYNDSMAQYDLNIQNQMKTLSDTWLAGTAQWVMAMQSAIEKTGLAKLALSQQYAQQLKGATEIMKMQIDKRTPNIDITNQINDGYLHNAQGDLVVWPTWKPLVSNPQKKLSTTTMDNNGNMIGIYSDGTHDIISEGQRLGANDIQNYAKAVQAGGESILNMLPKNVQQQVVAYMGQSGMVWLDIQMKQQQLDMQRQQLAGQGWQEMNDGSGKMINPRTREVWDPGQQDAKNMTVDFIKSKEGFRSEAYLDSAGIPTIWYGFTTVNWRKVQMGDTITQEEADQQFSKQLEWYQNWKNYIDPSTLSPQQQTALTSFEYNLWSGIWSKNAMPILNKIKSGDISGAQSLMKQFVNAGGRPVQGLVNRRNEEAELLWIKGWSQQQQSIPSSAVSEAISQCKEKAQCGAGVNDYLRRIGSDTHFVDSYESKKKEINSKEPVVGGIAIWQPTGWGAQPKYWHVGIVVEDLWDSVMIHDWNWDGKENQATHKVLKSTIAQSGGYHIPDVLQKTQSTGGGYSPDQQAILSGMPKTLKDIGKDEQKMLKQYWLSPLDVAKYSQEKPKGQNEDVSVLSQWIWRDFIEWGKTPTEFIVKSTWLSPAELINQWVKQYVEGKNKWLKTLWLEISDISPYISADEEQRKNMGKAITMTPDLIRKIDRWKELVDKYWTESESTDVWAEMKQLRTDVLTTLKSDAFLNLWVLQPVDLQFMEWLVPDSNASILPEWNQSENLWRLRENFLWKIKTNGAAMGIWPVQSSQTQSQQGQPAKNTDRIKNIQSLIKK